LTSGPSVTRYTKADLLHAARDAGYAPSARLITDWVSVGLLDHPHRRGLGRGKGISSTWPQAQLDLFLTLLRQRETVTRIATLCNVPVGVWLWWGDHFVPTRQARAALGTWAHMRERADSWRAARETASELVGRFAAPDASKSAREHVTELIARSAYGHEFNGVEVLAAFRRVFDPRDTGRALGPEGVRFMPEHYIFITEARLRAIHALRRSSIDDEAFEWARREYLTSRREYAHEIAPKIAADPQAASVFFTRWKDSILLPDTTLDQVLSQACVDLLTVLGIYLNYRQPHPPPSTS
jgi:hypothetical protein